MPGASPTPGLRGKVVRTGGLAALLSAMRRHPSSAPVQANGCSALGLLGADPLHHESVIGGPGP